MRRLDMPLMTLDELIIYLEKLTLPMTFEALKTDALHYLKMYRSDKLQREADKKAYEDERQKAIHATKKARERYIALAKDTKDELAVLRDYWAEQQDNNPLTWDELKSMEGKPVWIEDGLENGEWYIIECFTESGRFIAHDRYADDTVFKAIDMGNMWQAFRKERSCT